MGLTWAIPAFLAGILVEIFIDPYGEIVDIWSAALAYPAFLGGVAFSSVLRIVAGRRRFDELSVPQVAACGAAGGLALGSIAAVLFVGVITNPLVTALVIAVPALGAAVAAAGSLVLARMSEDRELLEASADIADVGLTSSETQELLGSGS